MNQNASVIATKTDGDERPVDKMTRETLLNSEKNWASTALFGSESTALADASNEKEHDIQLDDEDTASSADEDIVETPGPKYSHPEITRSKLTPFVVEPPKPGLSTPSKHGPSTVSLLTRDRPSSHATTELRQSVHDLRRRIDEAETKEAISNSHLRRNKAYVQLFALGVHDHLTKPVLVTAVSSLSPSPVGSLQSTSLFGIRDA